MNKKDDVRLREMTAQVMAQIKRDYPNLELHHIFGRIGRLAACRKLIAPLTPDDHRGKGYGARLEGIRDKFRNLYLEIKKANWLNRNQSTCWYRRCDRRKECPLYEEV